MSQQPQERSKTIHRVEKDRNYLVIKKDGPHDERLTFGARGLLTYMLTMPDDWAFYDEELAKHTPETLYKVRNFMKELKKYGYVKKMPLKDSETHRITKWETVLFEVPQTPDIVEEEEKPDVEIQQPGENIDSTPDVEKPHSGFPDVWDSTRVENCTLLSIDSLPSIEKPIIPVGEQKPAPQEIKLPEIQQATANLFLLTGKKQQLSPDDVICLNLLFKIHTPAAIQKVMLDSFKRLEKNGSVTFRHIDDKDYIIRKPETLPIRYIYNSMSNWSSLKNTGGGQRGQTRGNPARANKDYSGKAVNGIFAD